MKEFSTYIFDLDGTLLSTLDDLALATNYALNHHGLPQRTNREIRQFVGNGVRKLIERAVPETTDADTTEMVLNTFRNYYMEHSLDNTVPYPGVTDLLKELKNRNKNIAVVSNKFYDATCELCRHFFGTLVDVAIGERETIRKKPSPDTVIEALRRLGTDRENAVYIGDSDVDIATARNSGLPCISVLWGFRDKAFLEECGATTFVTEPKEILWY